MLSVRVINEQVIHHTSSASGKYSYARKMVFNKGYGDNSLL